MKTLCVYYSRTGTTKEIAQTVAGALHADLLAVTDGVNRAGVSGYIGAAVDGLRKMLPVVRPFRTPRPLERYDRVIVAAPIWCEDVCPVIRAFLTDNRGRFKGELCYIVTHMSALSYAEKITGLVRYAGKEPADWLSVQTKNYDWTQDVADFLHRSEARK